MIDLAEPARVVWRVLGDFDAYPGWNPFITAAEGLRVADGSLPAFHAMNEALKARAERTTLPS